MMIAAIIFGILALGVLISVLVIAYEEAGFDESTLGCFLFSLLIVIICIVVIVSEIPEYKKIENDHYYEVEKADENTYENRKKVEDTCRAYIASYEADCITWLTCSDSGNKMDLMTANAAKIRANRTAAVYNEYFLKNSFVWEGNIPEDIKAELEYLK